MIQEEINKKIANELAFFLCEHDLGYETLIYFNNMAYELDNNDIEVLHNVKGSSICEYANDDTVTVTFEGTLYQIMNGYLGASMYHKIEKIFEKYDMYSEMGNSWNISLYKI